MNKLGIDEYKSEKISNQIVEFKTNLIDEYFTFECNSMDIKYLQKMHEFLFGDVLHEAGKIRTVYTKEEIEEYNKILLCVNDMIIYKPFFDQQLFEDSIILLLDAQLFVDGNKRTIKAYVKQLLNFSFINETEYNEIEKYSVFSKTNWKF